MIFRRFNAPMNKKSSQPHPILRLLANGPRRSLRGLDEIADADGVDLCMAMAFHRIRAARGFDKYVGPNDACLDMDRGDFGNADAHFVFPKP